MDIMRNGRETLTVGGGEMRKSGVIYGKERNVVEGGWRWGRTVGVCEIKDAEKQKR